jgi:hypothetical protein
MTRLSSAHRTDRVEYDMLRGNQDSDFPNPDNASDTRVLGVRILLALVAQQGTPAGVQTTSSGESSHSGPMQLHAKFVYAVCTSVQELDHPPDLCSVVFPLVRLPIWLAAAVLRRFFLSKARRPDLRQRRRWKSTEKNSGRQCEAVIVEYKESACHLQVSSSSLLGHSIEHQFADYLTISSFHFHYSTQPTQWLLVPLLSCSLEPPPSWLDLLLPVKPPNLLSL